jgi:hypothetical protein
MRRIDAFEAHQHARLLRARYARQLARRLWRAVKDWLNRPWSQQRLAFR